MRPNFQQNQIMRVAIYSRVSTEEQKSAGFSLQDQERKLRVFCKERGYLVVDHYSDDRSGKTFIRPEFQRFEREIKVKRIEALVCMRYDRFSRNAQDTFSMKTKLEKKGVGLVFVEQNVDLTVPENLLLHAVYSVIPQIENDRKSLNTRAGMRQAQREGRWMWKAPFGYKNDTVSKQVIPSDDAHFVKKAFHMVGDLKVGPMRAYQVLKTEGLSCSKQCFLDILKREFYVGRIRVKATVKEPEEVVSGQHEALVSTELFDRVQAQRYPKNRNNQRDSQNTHLFPLRGSLECGKCGGKLTGSRSRGRSKMYDYYHCQKGCKVRFSANAANSEFSKMLEELKFSKPVISAYREVLWGAIQSKGHLLQERMAQAEKSLAKMDSRLERLDYEYMDSLLNHDDYARMTKKAREQKVKIELEREQISSEQTTKKEQVFFGVSLLEDLSGTYERADAEVKKLLVGSIFSEKLCFDGKKYRTAPLNPAIELMASNIKSFKRAKKRQASKNRDLSSLAPPPGLEPGTY